MLNKLGIHTDVYHANEGHAALLNLQRLADYVQNDHLPFNVALEIVRASSLYTVHTPVRPDTIILKRACLANILANILQNSVYPGQTS